MPGLPDDPGRAGRRPAPAAVDRGHGPDAPLTGDRAARGSAADLLRRLERLPHGHPSSPYHDDGTAKPALTRLKDLELPLPPAGPVHAGPVQAPPPRAESGSGLGAGPGAGSGLRGAEVPVREDPGAAAPAWETTADEAPDALGPAGEFPA